MINKLISIFVLAASSLSANAQNLVVDPSFEDSSASWISSSMSAGGGFAHTGTRAASSSCSGANSLLAASGCTIYQDVPTAVGASYTLTFWYRTWGAADAPAELQVLFGAIPVSNGGYGTCTGSCVYRTQTPTTTWTQITQTVTATATTTRLQFLGRDDPNSIYVDDVSLVLATPAPSANSASIPTLSEYGLIILAMFMAIFSAKRLRFFKR
jgi:hypothetical protein